MAVINNQGYRRDLNLEETPDDGGAFDNLAGAGAASDIRLLQNNLRNTSRVGFNTISNNFFSFAFDRKIGISTLTSSQKDLANTVITITLTEPYEVKKGHLVELRNITGVSSAVSLNGQYSVQSVTSDLKVITLINSVIKYTNTSDFSSGVDFVLKPQDIFTFTDGDIVGLSTDITFTVGGSTTSLTKNNTYFVVNSNGVNEFKLSSTSGGSAIVIDGISPSSPDNFSFIRSDAVYQRELINYIEPDIQDSGEEGDDFRYLDESINNTFDNTITNIETSDFFASKKYRGDQDVTTNEQIKTEGNISLNDPVNNITGNGVDNSNAPGIYIGNTRAFSSDNNPWNKVGTALTTSSEEVSIGELVFLDGTVLNGSQDGSMIIEGIKNDITSVSGQSADSSLSGGNFTHKLPIKVQDENGDQEIYYLLLSNT